MRTLLKYTGIAIAVIVVVLMGITTLLTSLDTETYKYQLTSMLSDALGREVTIAGDIQPVFSLSPSLRANEISIANAEWYNKSPMLTAKELTFHIRLLPLLSGTLDVEAIRLSHASIDLATNRNGESSWDFEKKDNADNANKANKTAEKTNKNDQSIVIQTITLDDVKLTYNNLQTRSVTAININESSFTLSENSDGLEFELDGNYGRLPFQIAGNVQMDEAGKYPLNVTLDSNSNTIKLTGDVSTNDSKNACNLAIDTKMNNLPELVSSIAPGDTSLPDNASGTLILRCMPDKFELSAIKFVSDGSHIDGNLSISTRTSTPHITGDLHLDKLPDALMNSKSDSASPTNSDDSSNDSSKEPKNANSRMIPDIDMPKALSIGLDIGVKIDSIAQKNFKADNVNISISGDSKRLNIKTNDLSLAQGKLFADISYNFENTSFKLNISAKNMNTGELTTLLDFKDTINEGTSSASLEITGQGTSLHPIIASSQGTTRLYTENAIYQREVTMGGAADFLQLLSGKTGKKLKIKCAISDLSIRNGQMSSNALVFDTTGAQVIGNGSADLNDETLDFIFNPKAKDIGLGNLAVPMRLQGSFQHPTFSPDSKALAISAGKTALSITSGADVLSALGVQVSDNQGEATDQNPCLKALNNNTSPRETTPPSETPNNPLKTLEKSLEKKLKGELNRFLPQ